MPPGGPWDLEYFSLTKALAGSAPNGQVFELLRGTAEFTFSEAGSIACVGMDGLVEADGVQDQIGVRIPVSGSSTLTVRSNLAYIAFVALDQPKSRVGLVAGAKSELRYLAVGDQLEQAEFHVDPASNRAGVRLNGLPPKQTPEIASEPSCVGAIQLTPSGQLIVIGPDGPTIGGYPKVGTVIEADLDFVPRLLPGRTVELVPIKWDEARRVAEERSRQLEKAIELIRIGQA